MVIVFIIIKSHESHIFFVKLNSSVAIRDTVQSENRTERMNLTFVFSRQIPPFLFKKPIYTSKDFSRSSYDLRCLWYNIYEFPYMPFLFEFPPINFSSHFSLDWPENTPIPKLAMTSIFHSGLSKDLSLILIDADDFNVIIQVGENRNMKEFYAHSVILRARSPYFKSAFSSNWITKKNDMIMFNKPNIAPAVFEMILK